MSTREPREAYDELLEEATYWMEMYYADTQGANRTSLENKTKKFTNKWKERWEEAVQSYNLDNQG